MIERYDKDDLTEALRVLRAGGVILYPTDTVWGIGCDARSEEAVRRIYEIKHRADSKQMLCLMDTVGRLAGYVDEVPDLAYDLIEMSNKPLTIIYEGGRNVAPSLLGEEKTLGIRITSEPFSAALCAGLKGPLVSTSANISGEPAAAYFEQISKEIIEAVDYVVRYRQSDTVPHQPSSVIMLGKGNVVKVIRP